MKFPAKAPAGPKCPECGSTEKRFPPGRVGAYHVFCDTCGYDFGRFDSLSRHQEHLLDDLERKLGIRPTSPDDQSALAPRR